MEPLLIRLDPCLPIAWETLDTLRIGFDRAEALVHNPSPGAQRFIGMLRTGVLSTRLGLAARKAGLAPRAQKSLLRVLAPALLYEPQQRDGEARRTPLIAISGGGSFTAWLHRELLHAGLVTVSQPRSADLVLYLERFRRPASQAQSLLQHQIPHLPIRMTDRSVCVGPLVSPTGAPCLACVELHERDRDPNAIVLAAQLGEHTPSTETENVARFTASLTKIFIDQWVVDRIEIASVRLRYEIYEDVPSVIPRFEHFDTHAECECANQAQLLAA